MDFGDGGKADECFGAERRGRARVAVLMGLEDGSLRVLGVWWSVTSPSLLNRRNPLLAVGWGDVVSMWSVTIVCEE